MQAQRSAEKVEAALAPFSPRTEPSLSPLSSQKSSPKLLSNSSPASAGNSEREALLTGRHAKQAVAAAGQRQAQQKGMDSILYVFVVLDMSCSVKCAAVCSFSGRHIFEYDTVSRIDLCDRPSDESSTVGTFNLCFELD